MRWNENLLCEVMENGWTPCQANGWQRMSLDKKTPGAAHGRGTPDSSLGKEGRANPAWEEKGSTRG
jgi:hypothetical protein